MRLILVISILLSAVPAIANQPGDFDGDGDIDLLDFTELPACLVGPASSLLGPGCDAFDYDGDSDIDLADFAGFQRAFQGPLPAPNSLLLDPVPGLTTQSQIAPATTAVPMGTTISFQFSWSVPGLAVRWVGATETGRTDGSSQAQIYLDQPGVYIVAVETNDGSGWTVADQSVLNVVDIPLQDISCGIDVSVAPLQVDENSSNETTMAYYFGPSIAQLTQIAPGYYRTSILKKLTCTVQTAPSGFEPLMEWRREGTVVGFGETLLDTAIGYAGSYTIEAGPASQAAQVQIETYRVNITSHASVVDIVPEGQSVTFTAETYPPGYEDDITWLSSTEYGTAGPVLGSGPTFTVQFDGTWGPSEQDPDELVQWLGVKADHARFFQDQRITGCCLPDGTCIDTTPADCAAQGGTAQGHPCGPPEACCLPNGSCIDTDPACCLLVGGIPDGPGLCAPLEACCLPDGSCINTDPNCCLLAGGIPDGPGLCAPLEACCLPDGSCVDSDPGCCALILGGIPDGPGLCMAQEACCLPDGTCVMADPDCCLLAGGEPQGEGTDCDPKCTAALGDAIGFPNTTVTVSAVIRNTGACEETFDWTVTKTAGPPTVTPTPASGSVTIVAGGESAFTVDVQIAAGSALGAATLQLEVKVDGAVTCSDTGTVMVTNVILKQLTYTGTKFHSVAKDNDGVAYAAPHWQDNNGDVDAEDAGDRKFPAAYTRHTATTASKVAVKDVTFTIQPGVTPVASVPVKGTGPDGDDFSGTGAMAGGQLVVAATLTSDDPLPDSVQFYNTYDITWEVALDGANFMPAGTSKNRIYATLDDPDTTPLYETVIDIACRNAVGKQTVADVATGIYADFTDRKVARKAIDGLNVADGKQMRYWVNVGDPLMPAVAASCQTLEAMLNPTPANAALNGIGTCLAWARLLEATFDAHKLRDSTPAPAVIVEVESARANDPPWAWGGTETRGLFLVKDWTFAAAGTAPGGCAPFTHRNAEVTDENGAPGQGASTNPPGAFFNHFIIRFGGEFYDPSYGTVLQTSQANWEQASLDGYRKICDLGATGLSVNAPETGAVETTFNP